MRIEIHSYDIIHYVIGLLAGMLNYLNVVAALEVVLIFIAYELAEYVKKLNSPHRDILVFALGWASGYALPLLYYLMCVR